MGVYDADRHEHLSHEMRLIESALARGVPVLAVCLGSQLLAHVLGARVAPAGFLEVGWLPVALDPAAASDPLLGGCSPGFTALHWHGDAFELPRAAIGLARSERTPLQAFRHGSAHGLLFHAEVDETQVQAMARAFPADLERAGTSAPELLDGVRRHGASLRELATEIYGRFARLAGGD
jgi:GMP synthase (glutamine-hydrolysing)